MESLIEEILQNVSEPKIPEKEYNLLDFGAVGDGKTDCTEAFAKAIEEISKVGGGRLVVPKGVYLTGPIHLKSFVELRLQDATIKFHTDPKRYLPVVLTRFEGIELYNYSPLIYANSCQNVAITGNGVLDGQASEENWWFWKGKKSFGWREGLPDQTQDVLLLKKMAASGVPVEQRIFGEGHYLRPSFVQFYRCRNVLIEGVRIVRSPMWCVHPVLCENVVIRNVEISSKGPNNDGIDPESCRYVLIENCKFDTGDDSVVIKSGRDEDGRRVGIPSEYILIRNNLVLSEKSHGGVVIGSEMSGGVRNVVAYNNVFVNLERVLRIKSNSRRGGYIENVFFFDNIALNVSDEFIVIDLRYDNEEGEFPPIVKNVHVRNLRGVGGKYGVRIEGLPNAWVSGVVVENTTIEGVEVPIRSKFAEITFRHTRINGIDFSLASFHGNVEIL